MVAVRMGLFDDVWWRMVSTNHVLNMLGAQPPYMSIRLFQPSSPSMYRCIARLIGLD